MDVKDHHKLGIGKQASEGTLNRSPWYLVGTVIYSKREGGRDNHTPMLKQALVVPCVLLGGLRAGVLSVSLFPSLPLSFSLILLAFQRRRSGRSGMLPERPLPTRTVHCAFRRTLSLSLSLTWVIIAQPGGASCFTPRAAVVLQLPPPSRRAVYGSPGSWGWAWCRDRGACLCQGRKVTSCRGLLGGDGGLIGSVEHCENESTSA